MQPVPDVRGSLLEAAASRLPGALTSPGASIAEAMSRIDSVGTGAVVLVDDARHLCGVVTDGDIRRAILAGIPLTRECGSIATRTPVVGSAETSSAEALRLMDHAHGSFVNNLPLVDDDGQVVGLVLRRDVVADDSPRAAAVLMAGGYGTRLLPLTNEIPKPMLPVGKRPLLERTLARLQESGLNRVVMSVHHKADQITDHFGNGRSFGVDVDYLQEKEPLGTAGALRLLDAWDEPLLLVNGDILTNVHFGQMIDYHRQQRATVTVGLRQASVELPYGVVDCDGPWIRAVREKPCLQFFLNAGIYVLEPEARQYIPDGRRFDMTDLIADLLAAGRPVAGFPILEYWLDIGRPDDYEQAQVDLARIEGGSAR